MPILVPDHRRQLEEIADHQELHPAEGPVATPVAPQNGIHPIEQIGPHHADFIDHEKVEISDDVDLVPAESILGAGRLAPRDKGAEG